MAILIKKRWETCREKAASCLFSPGLARGPAGIKSWGFVFHRVQALGVQMPYPRSQLFPRHTTAGRPAKDCCGSKLEDDYKCQWVKVGLEIWVSYLPELPEFFPVHWETLALISGGQYCHQHNTTVFLIKMYLQTSTHVSGWEALFYKVLSKQSLNSNLCWIFFRAGKM